MQAESLVSSLPVAGVAAPTPATGRPRLRRILSGLRPAALACASLALFCLLWQGLASHLVFGNQRLPGPGEVGTQILRLTREHLQASAAHATAMAAWRIQYEEARVAYAGELTESELAQALPRPIAQATVVDWILTSLVTVFTGFALAALVGVPLGIICGLSSTVWQLCNPLIQLFKPVSPLAWLPMVAILVGAAVANDAGVSKSWLTASIVVALCSVWPTLINTANGVANVDRDVLNVARVLNLGFLRTAVIIVLPASLPAIFTGLRLSLGIGWMVLIAAEMLSQNPGLGKFIWDMYQSSNDATLAVIAAIILVIGVIGFALDRSMTLLQNLAARGAPSTVR